MDLNRRHIRRMKFQIEDGTDVDGDANCTHDLATTQSKVVHGTCGDVVSGAFHRELDAIPGLLPQFGQLLVPFILCGEWLHVGNYFRLGRIILYEAMWQGRQSQ